MRKMKKRLAIAVIFAVSLPLFVFSVQAQVPVQNVNDSLEKYTVAMKESASPTIAYTLYGAEKTIQAINYNQTTEGDSGESTVEPSAFIAVSLGLLIVSGLGGCALFKKR